VISARGWKGRDLHGFRAGPARGHPFDADLLPRSNPRDAAEKLAKPTRQEEPLANYLRITLSWMCKNCAAKEMARPYHGDPVELGKNC